MIAIHDDSRAVPFPIHGSISLVQRPTLPASASALASTVTLMLALALALALVLALVPPSPTLAAPTADSRAVGGVSPRCNARPGCHEAHLGHHTLGAATAAADGSVGLGGEVGRGGGRKSRACVSVTPDVLRVVFNSINILQLV